MSRFTHKGCPYVPLEKNKKKNDEYKIYSHEKKWIHNYETNCLVRETPWILNEIA